jgi:hypothetical protein
MPKRLKKLIDTINSCRIKKINPQKSIAFLYINNEQTEKEYRKTISFAIA